MSKLMGRTDDMLIIRGVNIFPSQVENVLLGIPGAAPHYLLVVDRVNNLDTLEIQAELAPDFPFDKVRRVEELERNISREVLSALGVTAKITMKPPGSIERFELKAKRIIDKRKD
jgi:phenylacetate-CoA ligase